MLDGAGTAHLGFGGAAGGFAAEAGALFVGGGGFEETVELFVELAVYALLLEEGFEAGFQVREQVHRYSPLRFLCSAGMENKYNSRSFDFVPVGHCAQDDNSVGRSRSFALLRMTTSVVARCLSVAAQGYHGVYFGGPAGGQPGCDQGHCGYYCYGCG